MQTLVEKILGPTNKLLYPGYIPRTKIYSRKNAILAKHYKDVNPEAILS